MARKDEMEMTVTKCRYSIVDNKMNDRLQIPPLKRANVTTEPIRRQNTAGTVCEQRARNYVLRASQAEGVRTGLSPKFSKESDEMLTCA